MSAPADRSCLASALEGLELAWAVACADPRCEGLEYSMHNGVLCGWDARADEPRALVLVVHETGWLRRVRARRAVSDVPEHAHALDYCPLEDWTLMGKLIETHGIAVQPERELAPDEPRLWRARMCDIDVREQPSAAHAVLRVFVAARLGARVVLPRTLFG